MVPGFGNGWSSETAYGGMSASGSNQAGGPSPPGAAQGPCRLVGVVEDELDQPLGLGECRIKQERREEPVEAGGLEVPVDHQHAPPVARDDPRHVGERQGAAGPPLYGIERDDRCRRPAVRSVLPFIPSWSRR